ncbi:MAG: hypothetical protein R3C19_02150 [Planctomycetaceae bacterium]
MSSPSAKLLRMVLLTASLLPSPLAAQPVARDRADRMEARFVDQISRRLLFETAEQHCRQQIAAQSDAERQAFWHLKLCDVYRRHAWFASAANRQSLLAQSVETITLFLESAVVSPETELLLRLDQVSSLKLIAETSAVIDRAGHLVSSTNHDSEPHKADQPSLATIDKGIELADALMTQLETVRRNLDSEAVRDIRGKRPTAAGGVARDAVSYAAGSCGDQKTSRRGNGIGKPLKTC